jgi:hypothetical protein
MVSTVYGRWHTRPSTRLLFSILIITAICFRPSAKKLSAFPLYGFFDRLNIHVSAFFESHRVVLFAFTMDAVKTRNPPNRMRAFIRFMPPQFLGADRSGRNGGRLMNHLIQAGN